MGLKNTSEHYGSVSKTLHWVLALIFIGLFVSAYLMMPMAPSDSKWAVYSLHKSFGVLTLFLVVVRLCWKVINIAPKLPTSSPIWQIGLSHLTHYGLYALMFAMPLSGYVMSTAAGYEVMMFNLRLPVLLAKDLDTARAAREAHTIISYLLLGSVTVHVLAALWHHFWRKDNILKRMLPTFSAR